MIMGFFSRVGDGSGGAGGIALGKLQVRRKVAAQTSCLQRYMGRFKKFRDKVAKIGKCLLGALAGEFGARGGQTRGTN